MEDRRVREVREMIERDSRIVNVEEATRLVGEGYFVQIIGDIEFSSSAEDRGMFTSEMASIPDYMAERLGYERDMAFRKSEGFAVYTHCDYKEVAIKSEAA